MPRLGVAALVSVLALTGCSGSAEVDFDGNPIAEPDADGDGDAVEEAVEAPTMPDVVGMHVDEAVAELEEAGFRVSTGIVRTTEVEPDIVYRSEPAPGRRVQEGQRVTLRIAAEPRG